MNVYDAIIVGAGYGGLGAAAQLQRAGIDNFVVLERAEQIGGVWRDNTYPGAACDTQAIVYCYMYFPHLAVTKLYSEQPELLGYLEALATNFGLLDRVRLGADVVSAVWDDNESLWTVSTAEGIEYKGRAFVPAWGQLGVPNIPKFKGQELFAGTAFHSAQWNHEVDLTGLRVASVGAAASAVQYIPEVAKVAGQLTVFQRSANYIVPRGQKQFSAAERKSFQENPQDFERLRNQIHETRELAFERVKNNSAEQALGVAEARQHLESQISDPELRKKLTPDYEFGCKRILRADDYYPALNRDNVELVTDAIEEITPEGIRTVDGEVRGFDVIIYGTGFRSQAFQHEMRIIGRNGVSLNQRWGEEPEAYYGLSVDGFPNMFLVYGPNTNLNHNSIVTMMEVQHEFIVDRVRALRDESVAVFDVRPEVIAEHNDLVQAELEKSSYTAECSSWYKNEAGRVINNWYGTVEDYRQAVEAISPADFGLESWQTHRAGAGAGV